MPDAPKPNPYLEEMRKQAKAMGATLMRVADTPSMLGSGINNKYIAVLAQSAYQPNDLVVFKGARGNLVIHPVTHVKPGYVYTKGTFNKHGDGWIPLSDVVGKTTKILDPEKSVRVTKSDEAKLNPPVAAPKPSNLVQSAPEMNLP